jgi:iron complex outermembrane receptor protein
LRTGFRHLREEYRFKQTEQVQEKEKVNLSDNVYEAGAIFTPSPQSSLYLNFSTSLRYPLVDEFFSSNTYGTGGLNTSLQPQTSKNLEIGGRYAFAPRTFLNINSFFVWTKNEIYFDPLTFVNSNYDKTERWGWELESQVPLTDSVAFFTNYTFIKALFGDGAYDGQDVPTVPRHQTSGGLRWTPRDNLSLALHIDYVGSMYLINDEANEYKPLDAFVTGGIDATFSLKGTELFVRLDNLLDAEYSEYGVVSTFAGTRNFYPAAGRRVLAGLRHLF